jgi:DNA-binding transcriptional MerR regulator
MNKYNIEGGVDFFAELYKSIDTEISYEKMDQVNNVCLITNELLTDKYVTLKCGHKFNYIPLYHDLVNHKRKFNRMEGTFSRLNMNEIRCPYCREKQQFLLPYYEELGLQKVNGVNFYDPYFKENFYSNTYTSPKCEYKFLNTNYDPLKEESSVNKKYLSTKCHMYGTKINVYNNKNPSEPITFGDTNHYCYSHKKIMIKKYKAQQKETEFLAKKQAKQLEKQTKLLEKQKIKDKAKEEKQKAKEEKQKAKEEKQKAKHALKTIKDNSMEENIVSGLSNIENQVGCFQILKAGPNKGKHCGCKIFTDNLCKRHCKKINSDN